MNVRKETNQIIKIASCSLLSKGQRALAIEEIISKTFEAAAYDNGYSVGKHEAEGESKFSKRTIRIPDETL